MKSFLLTAQGFWNAALIITSVAVALGHWRQGMIVYKAKSATHLSLALPCAVFVVQIILFIKGIYYRDLALIISAVVVSAAVLFDICQIIKFRER
jgi:hypothetical protein